MILGVNAAAAAMQRMGKHIDPFRAYCFFVEIQGIFVGGFTSVEGIQANVEVSTVREGGRNDTEYKLAGQVTYGDLILNSGLTYVDPMWFWYKSTLSGKIQRRNGTIYLLSHRGIPVAWWNFYHAWPTSWEGPRFDSTQTLVASQRFTLAHEGIEKSERSSAAGAAEAML
jgi:phage tail-like protein